MGSSKIGVHPKSISSLYPWINFAFLGHPESWHKASQSQVYQVGCIMLYIPSHSHDVSIIVHDWFTTFYNLIQVLNMIFPELLARQSMFHGSTKKRRLCIHESSWHESAVTPIRWQRMFGHGYDSKPDPKGARFVIAGWGMLIRPKYDNNRFWPILFTTNNHLGPARLC